MLISEAIRLAKEHIGQDKDSINRLNGALTDSATSVPLDFASPLPAAGSRIEMRSSTTSELAHVWSISSQTATVARGRDGSTAAAFSDEDDVAINPIVSNTATYKAITRELEGLPAEGLTQIKTGTLTYSYTTEGYSTTAITDLITPLMIHMVVGARDYWIHDFYEFPDLIRPKAYDPPDGTITLHYRAPFTAPSDYSDDLSTDLGVPDTAQDIVAIGAAIRLFYSQEQLRGQANTQQHARAPEDVQPGSGARSVSLLSQWKATRLAHETMRQREKYPRRRQ